MERKTHLLSNLKRQVIALKFQLEKLEKNKHGRSPAHCHSPAHKSISTRFDSVSLDCTYLDKGIRKFPEKHLLDNLSQLIQRKSQAPRIPTFSSQRKQEYEQTRHNFSSDNPVRSPTRSRSPNPITGEGYRKSAHGIRTCYKERKEIGKERRSQKKHFWGV